MTPEATLLEQLRDIHGAAPPQLWPPAPGWWVVAAIVLAVLCYAGLRGLRARRRARLRRAALKGLDALCLAAADPARSAAFVAEVSERLRRVALNRFPRDRVASLTGDAWLGFLDETGGGTRFRRGPGRVLAVGPYLESVEVDARALLGLATDWVKRNC